MLALEENHGHIDRISVAEVDQPIGTEDQLTDVFAGGLRNHSTGIRELQEPAGRLENHVEPASRGLRTVEGDERHSRIQLGEGELSPDDPHNEYFSRIR